mgnify:CR=1 FL=1
MPRTFQMTCDRYLSDKVTPGNRVTVVGVLQTYSNSGNVMSNNKVRNPVYTSYIRVLGIQSMLNKDGMSNTGFALPNITSADEEKI